MQTPLTSRVIKTELIKWKEMHFIQQDDFKDWTPEAKARLKTSVLENQFTQPFYVWQDPADGVIYCLDGRHRTLIMKELEAEALQIPDLLPATFIDCGDKKEAARLVVIYSSIYARITQQGLFNFIQMYDLEYESVKQQMDIPEFSTERFEQKFDLFQIHQADEPEPTVEDCIVSPGAIFQMNGHRIACGCFYDNELMKELMQGRKGRILNCDPPYNIPVNSFSTKHTKDFTMGAGEMSDEEYVQFLSLIMKAAIENTMPGAIHYIFIDWRHVWHMTEAGRRVYGSPKPKQMCVWHKDHMGNGSFYRPKHELCFVFNDSRAKALWNKDLLDHGGEYKDNSELVFIFKSGEDQVKHLSHLEMKDRIRTNVWNYPSTTSAANPDRYELKNHPTPKPVQMIADSILDTTNPQDLVLDFFLGSGTCLIAAEQTERICYATEIEPNYIQSTITRYLNHCNKKGIDVNFSHVNGTLTINDFQHEPTLVS